LKVLAIDPGSSHSACVLWEPRTLLIRHARWEPNQQVLDLVDLVSDRRREYQLVIEQITAYTAGKTVADTCWWSGRYYQAWPGKRKQMMPYREVSIAHTGRTASKEILVQEELLGRFGPIVTAPLEAQGKKAAVHLWSAFAVAVTWSDQQNGATRIP
jgi:hypothetical protein